jgi:thioredoxin reductase (NADPH)
VRANEKITIHYNVAVTDVLGESGVQGLVIQDLVSGESSTLPVQGFFVAIGHQPNTEIFRGVLEMDEVGYLKAHENTMSSRPGIFIAGDVADHRYRQAVTAAGDGCRAAIDAERWLELLGEADEEHTIDPGTWGTAATILSGSAES